MTLKMNDVILETYVTLFWSFVDQWIANELTEMFKMQKQM